MERYRIEVRGEDGKLDFDKENEKRKEHPYLFSMTSFSIDQLCHYASFGQGRNNPIGPTELSSFMKDIGVSYRIKYW